jgi:hypothetical protein
MRMEIAVVRFILFVRVEDEGLPVWRQEAFHCNSVFVVGIGHCTVKPCDLRNVAYADVRLGYAWGIWRV